MLYHVYIYRTFGTYNYYVQTGLQDCTYSANSSHIVTFSTRNDAVKYLKMLKREYNGEGFAGNGKIKGVRIRKTHPPNVRTHTVETVEASIIEAEFGTVVELKGEHEEKEQMCNFNV